MKTRRTHARLKRFAASVACALVVAVVVFNPFYPANAAEPNPADALIASVSDILMPEEEQPVVTDDSTADGAQATEASEDQSAVAAEAESEVPEGQQSANEADEPEEDESEASANKPDEDRAYSLRLLVKASAESIRTEDAALGEHDGVYLLGFADEEAMAAAEEYYAGVAEWCERDIPLGVSEGEAPEGDPVPVSAEDNALALLDEAEPEPVDVPNDKPLVALIDTGAPDDSAVMGAASVIGDDVSDLNGHATVVLEIMQQEDPDIQVFAIKALDDDGVGSASSVYAAIEYAISAGANIINLSLAGRASEGNAAIADAVNNALAAGIIVVASAGNGGYDASYFTPANIPGVITVGACDESGNPLVSSNRGEIIDYYVVADSTSFAAARLTGWLSFHAPADDWADLLASEEWVSFDIDAEGTDPGDLDDSIAAATDYKHTLTGGSGGASAVYSRSGSDASSFYLDSGYTQRMTWSSNPVPVPTYGSDFIFQGYYISSSGTQTPAINYRGYIERSTSNNLNNTWYARFSRVELNHGGGTSAQSYLYPLYADNRLYLYSNLTSEMSGSSNPVPIPTRSGWTFQGYFESSSSNTININYKGYLQRTAQQICTSQTGTSAKYTTDTIYARWGRIILSDGSGSGGQGYIYPAFNIGVYTDAARTQQMYNGYGAAVAIPTRAGYRFDGYYTTSTGTTQYIDRYGLLTSTGYSNMGDTSNSSWAAGDHTLYARWIEAPWTITLDKQGGSGGTDYLYTSNGRGTLAGIFFDIDGTNKYSSTNKVSIPSKPYQTFVGYYDSPHHEGTQRITSSGTTNNFSQSTFSANTTLYAAWDGLLITVNKQSGSGGTGNFYSFYNEGWGTNRYGSAPITSMTPPTRTNYTFMGYFTGTGGSGTQVTDAAGNFVVPNTFFRSATTIYAYWAPEHYVVTLDPQGADVSVGTPLLYTVYNQGIYTNIQFTNAVSSTIPIAVPQRAGYVFQGYYSVPQTSYTSVRGTRYINANGTLTGYLTKTNRQNRTLYAQWKVAPHTVTLDKQGGTGGTNEVYEMASVGVALDYAMTRKISYSGNSYRTNPVIAPTKPYQTFNGYYTQQYGRGTRLLTPAGYHVNGFSGSKFTTDATIYAYWTGFKLTLNRQGGSGGPNQIFEFYNEKYTSDEHGEPATIITSITPPRRSQYTFGGYYTQKDGQGTQVVDGAGNIVAPNTLFTANATLYAYWMPESYMITLVNNNADPGYEGSSEVWELYAVGVYPDNTFNSADLMNRTTNPITVPQRTGKVFRGYYTSQSNTSDGPNGSGTMRIDQDGYVRFSPTVYRKNDTLYARWLDAPLRIALDDDGGSGGSGEVWELYGDGVYRDQPCRNLMSGSTYPVAVPTKQDRVFAGYYTERDGGGSIKINERGYRQNFVNTFFTSDDTIYAFWRGYAIKLDDQGGRNGSGTIYEHYGVDFYADMRETTPIASVALPQRNNYQFHGYFTGRGGTGTKVIDENGNYEGVMTNTYYTADTTVYAYWTPAVYTIELDNQGADSGLEGSPEVYEQYSVGVYNDKLLVNTMTATINPITVPQKQFHNFGGYYTQQTGGAQRIGVNGYKTTAFSSTSYTSDDTLYARWLPLTITLDDQGGSGGSGAIYEDYGKGYYRYQNLSGQMTTSGSNRVAVPTKFNHVFKGYYTQPDGGGDCVIASNGWLADPSDSTLFTVDSTIYAYWEFNLDLPITGGEGLNQPLLWVAVLVVLCGGVVVVCRRLARSRQHRAQR